jgi:hypothetical protein
VETEVRMQVSNRVRQRAMWTGLCRKVETGLQSRKRRTSERVERTGQGYGPCGPALLQVGGVTNGGLESKRTESEERGEFKCVAVGFSKWTTSVLSGWRTSVYKVRIPYPVSSSDTRNILGLLVRTTF